jgi:hypothetical protein
MSKLYVHPVTGNVGIGTDKPDGILDIKSVITNAVFPPPGMSNVVAVPDYTNMVDSIDVGNMPTLVEYPPPLHLSATGPAVVDATVGSVTQSTITVAGSTYGNGAYVAIASSELGATTKAAKAFNKLVGTVSTEAWLSLASRYGGVDYVYNNSVSTTASGQALAGEWIQLRTPTAIALKSYALTNNGDDLTRTPVKWWVVGSTNGTTWTLLDSQFNQTWSVRYQSRVYVINNDNNYDYYRLIINQVRNDTNVAIGEWALSADAPYSNVREFPPGPMRDYITDLGAMYGGGRYVASASSEYNSSTLAYLAFDKYTSAYPNLWTSGVSSYSGANGSHLFSTTTSSQNGTLHAGEWLQIMLPYPIVMTSYALTPRLDNQVEAPTKFWILGSLTGANDSWSVLDTRDALSWSSSATVSFIPSTLMSPCTYFRIVVSISGNPAVSAGRNSVQIAEWKLFGSLHQKYPKLTLPLLGRQSTYGTGSYKAYANTLYNPGTPIAGIATNAIDANAATFWRSGSNLYTSAIDASPVPTVYFEFPDGLKATSYALTARQNAVTAFDEAPGKWNLYGSNMAAPGSWALLDARANISTWAAENPKTFALTGNTTFYNAYKIEVLRNNSASGNFITIRDVQWIGDKQTPDTKLMITTGGRIGMNALASSEYMLNVDGNIRATGDLIANGYVMGLPKMAIIQDRKPYNVSGGTAVANVFNTRALNTIIFDNIGITLLNNRFTLPIGLYGMFASAPSYGCARNQIRLRNVTSNTTILLGSSEYSSWSTTLATSRSIIDDVMKIEVISTFELQHWMTRDQAADGLGVSNDAVDNVYACVKLIKYT